MDCLNIIIYSINMTNNKRDYSERSAEVNKKYNEFLGSHNNCSFCIIGQSESINEILEENRYFWVIKNAFPYAVWDGRKVIEHLLIVPKQHIVSFSEMTNKQRKSMVKIINKYDQLEYSFMERCASNKEKSMPHQHTHLIKVI